MEGQTNTSDQQKKHQIHPHLNCAEIQDMPTIHFVHTHTHTKKQSRDTQVQCGYLLKGGSLALYRSLGPHLQLLAQCHQFLHLCHHQSLFLINQLEQGKKGGQRERCITGQQKWFVLVLSREAGLTCADTDRFMGLGVQCSESNTNQDKGRGGWHKFRFSVV